MGRVVVFGPHPLLSVTIEARGQSPLAQLLSVLTIGDWVSYYLALLNGADPTPVTAIDYLKAELARH